MPKLVGISQLNKLVAESDLGQTEARRPVIRLSSNEIDFLLGALALPPHLIASLRRAKDVRGRIGGDDADALLDLCGERLQVHGFGPGYEPTEEGKQLERMIDRLFVG